MPLDSPIPSSVSKMVPPSVRKARPSIFDRVYDRVVQKISTSRWQARLMRWPITKWIAHREAVSLYNICAGFAYTQILRACVEMDLFKVLAEEPRSLAALARKFQVPEGRLEVLLDGAIALKLIRQQKTGDYAIALSAAALIADDGLASIIRHHDLMYQDLADPLAFLRNKGGQSMQDFWNYDMTHTASAGSASDYTSVMASTQAMVASQVVAAYPFKRHRQMADVGGGLGVFATAVARSAPRLSITLLDLPGVAERANHHIAAEGLQAQVKAVAGDYRDLVLPEDTDLVTLVRVLHDQDDDDAARLMANVYRAVRPGTRILLAETMKDSGGSRTIGAGYFGLFLLAMGRGRVRSKAQISSFLRDAGFDDIHEYSTGLPAIVRVLTATRP